MKRESPNLTIWQFLNLAIISLLHTKKEILKKKKIEKYPQRRMIE